MWDGLWLSGSMKGSWDRVVGNKPYTSSCTPGWTWECELGFNLQKILGCVKEEGITFLERATQN